MARIKPYKPPQDANENGVEREFRQANRLDVFAIVKAVVITVMFFFATGMALGFSLYVLVVLVKFDIDDVNEELMLYQGFFYCVSLLPYVLGDISGT